MIYVYIPAVGILIVARSLQRNLGYTSGIEVSPKVFIFWISLTRAVVLVMRVCPSVSPVF